MSSHWCMGLLMEIEFAKGKWDLVVVWNDNDAAQMDL